MNLIFITFFNDEVNTLLDWLGDTQYWANSGFEYLVMSLQSLGYAYSSSYYNECIEILESIIKKVLFSKVQSLRILFYYTNRRVNELELESLELALNLLRWIVNRYRAGPLTLRELSRNAVRQSLGTVRFRERAKMLHLPSFIREFIICPVNYWKDISKS